MKITYFPPAGSASAIALFCLACLAGANAQETLPVLSASPARAVEGNSGNELVRIPLYLSAPAATPVTVSWSTANHSAEAGSDYSAGSGTAIFAPGEVYQTIAVAISGDTMDEPDELFTIQLSSPAGASLGGNSVRVMIENDEPVTTVHLGVSGGYMENQPASSIPFAVGNPLPGRTAQAMVTGGTATAGVDFALPRIPIDLSTRFPAFPVEVIDDTLAESNERFLLSLTGAGPGVRFSPTILGQTIPATGLPTGMALEDDLLAVTDGAQLRILRRQEGIWAQEAAFSGAAEGGVFAVALDQGLIAADFMATGVKLFSREAGIWTVVATLPRATAEADPRRMLVLQDDTLVIGDPQPAEQPGLSGEVRIHERHLGGPGAWGLRQTILPVTVQPDFGSAVSLWGPYLATNAPGSYSVSLFRRRAPDAQWEKVREFIRYMANFGRSIAVNGGVLVMSQSGSVMTSRRLDAAGTTWGEPVSQNYSFSQTHAQFSLRDGMLCGKTGESGVRILTFSGSGQWTEAMDANLGNNPSTLPRQIAFDGQTMAVTGNGDAAIAPVLIYGHEGWEGTVLDDEGIQFTVDNTSLEGGFPGLVTVRLSRPLPVLTSIRYSTVEGTALASSDFTATSGTAYISSGTTSTTIYINVSAPEAGEGMETFGIHLDSPTLGTAGPDAVITILPRIAELSMDTSSQEIKEGNSGSRTVTINTTLSQPAAAGDSYAWKLVDGTAKAGSDFPAAAGEVTLQEGATTSRFTLQILGDTIGEIDEQFTVLLEKRAGLRVSPNNYQTIVFISNDDTGFPASDNYSMVQGATLTGRNVRDNDSRVQQVALEGGPASGAFNLLADGSFTYTPTVNFVGRVSFGYRDEFYINNVAIRIVQAGITVTDGNVPPVLKADSYTIQEDTPLDTTAESALHLFSNDGLFSAEGVAYNPILEMSVQNISNGTLTNYQAGNGRFVFTPAPNFAGTAGFSYRVRDKDGWSDPATVTIRVQEDLPLPPLQRLSPPGSQLHRSIVTSVPFTATSTGETSFNFKAGQTVSFRALPGGAIVFSKMEIQDASGNILPGGVSGPNSIDNVPIPADGTYRIAAGRRGTAGTSTFHLLVNGGLPGFPTNSLAPYPLESARPPGSLRAAVAATMTSSQPHYYSLSGTAGEKIHIYLQSNQAQTFRLQTAQNSLLASSTISPYEAQAATLTTTLPATASYRLMVFGTNPADYTLQLFRSPETHELAASSPVPLVTSAAGHLTGRGVPAPTPADPGLTFAAFADYGSGSASQAAVAAMVKSWNPDFLIAAGDHNYSLDYTVGTPSWTANVGNFYGGFIKSRADNRYPEQTSPVQRFFPVPGNHDTGPDSANGGELSSYFDYFHSNPGAPPRLPAGVHGPQLSYYKMSQGNMDFFLLDSDNASVNPTALNTQRQWLKDQIRTSTALWKFGVWHHPPFSSSAVHGSQSFMQWGADFAGLTAIITGHDHTYERLNIGFDVAQFVVGIGGSSFYSFVPNPPPLSVIRYNSNYGALRVMAGSSGVQFDFLAIGTAGGTLIDSYTIGVPPDPVVPSGGDTWSLPVQRGTTLQLTTRTPRPPGLLQNPVDPLIQLLDHTGTVVASDSSSAFDGKNAKLIYRIPGTPQSPGETLPWTVRVLNETNSAGEYEIRVAEPTLNAYLAWAALQPAGFPPDIASDPDLDGLPNLMEYLMDSNPALASAPLVPTLTLRSGSPSTLQLNLPSAWTRPVAALLQTSAQLTGGTWTTLATKSAGQTYWLSSAPDQLPPSPGGAFTLPPAPGNRQFYRMAFVLE